MNKPLIKILKPLEFNLEDIIVIGDEKHLCYTGNNLELFKETIGEQLVHKGGDSDKFITIGDGYLRVTLHKGYYLVSIDNKYVSMNEKAFYAYIGYDLVTEEEKAMVRTYTKKPVAIEAIQLTKENRELVMNWISTDTYIKENSDSIFISTLEGDMEAIVSDYIIKGVQGEFYPCKEEIFYATYI